MRPADRHRKEYGAALLAAMLTVALVASFAASALWQQWRAVEVETAERSRVQAGWLLTGALDWARATLHLDTQSGPLDHLSEPWAAAPREARLSDFFAAGHKPQPAGDFEATFLTVQMEDMQARLNVANLVDAGRVSEADLHAFSRLFAVLALPQSELVALAAKLRLAADPESGQGAGAVPLLPQRVEQLAWLGLSPSSIDRLRPFIVVLPTRTAVNLNTAGAEVLHASIPGLDMAQAQSLALARNHRHYRSLEDLGRLLPGGAATGLIESRHSVASRFFEVRARLRTADLVLEERSLLQRDGAQIRTVWRSRWSA